MREGRAPAWESPASLLQRDSGCSEKTRLRRICAKPMAQGLGRTLIPGAPLHLQVPGGGRNVPCGQGPPEPVPGLPAEEVLAGGYEPGW